MITLKNASILACKLSRRMKADFFVVRVEAGRDGYEVADEKRLKGHGPDAQIKAWFFDGVHVKSTQG